MALIHSVHFSPSTPRIAASKKKRPTAANDADRVELGKTAAAPPVLPRPTPGRVRAEQLEVERRRSIRQQLAPEISTLNHKLSKGELKDEAFQQAARRLHDVVHGCADPLVARMARHPLYGRFQYKEPPYDHVFKMGPVKGPVYALEGKLGDITGYSRDRYYFSDNSFTPFLAALYQASEKSRPTPEAVAVVARLAHGFYARSSETLPEELRKHESPEQDRKWADTCVDVLATWWDEGSLTVLQSGHEQPVGSLDLLALLRERVPALRGTALDFTPIAPVVAPEAEALSERIGTWAKDPAPGIGELDQMAAADPERAARIARGFVDLAVHPKASLDSIERLARILKEGTPRVRELFRPELPRMTEMVSEAMAFDEVAPNNLWGNARAGYYTELVKSFPEVVDERLFKEQLEPLYYAEINGANELRPTLWELWDQHPELISGTIDRAMALPADFYPNRDATRLISEAVQKGWSPTPLQKDWLVSWLYQPNDGKDNRINHNDTFTWALRTVRELNGRIPGFLKGVELPDTKGNLRPLGAALLDRLRNDPEEDPVRTFFSKGNHGLTGSAVGGIYALAFPDDKLTGELLDLAETGYRRTGDCNKMARDEQIAMVILGSQDLPAWADERLKSLLSNERYRDQGWYVYNDIVDHYRQGYQAEAIELVKAPDSTLEQRLGAAREYLSLGVSRISDYDLDHYYRRVLEPLGEALKTTDVDSAFSALLDNGVNEAQRVDDLATMSRDAISNLVLARALATGRPELEAKYQSALRPLLGKPQGYQLAVRQLFDSERHRALQSNLEALKQPLKVAERTALVEDNLSIAKSTYEVERFTQETLEAWSAGPTEPWAARLTSLYQQPAKSWQAVAAVATGGPEPEPEKRTDRYLELFEKLGRENYHDNVLKAFESMSAALVRGVDRDEAFADALRDYLVGTPEKAPPDVGDIRKEEALVHVGAVSLPVRKG